MNIPRLYYIYTLLLCFYFGYSPAQTVLSYAAIDSQYAKAPASYRHDYIKLAHYLTDNVTGEDEKVHSLYTWIAHNIKYDIKAYNNCSGKIYTPNKILKRRKAVCLGYSDLFKAMCDECHINAAVIDGYAKGADKIIIILTVVSAAMLQLIDTSIVNVAINQMMGNLGATFEEIGWVITGYGVSNVIMITLSGWMSARFGRKNYFAASIIVFTIGSILCGLSTNVWELVAFRVLQGIGGGGLLSTAQAIIIETFPKEELGMANAIYGVGVIVGPTIGPTLGGYITDHASWQWIFYINIPFGILATFLTITFVKNPVVKPKSTKMDWTAFALLVAAISCLQIVLEKGQSEDWFQTRYITILSFIAGITGILFVWRELVVKDPIVNLRLFQNRSFSTGTIFNFILGFGLYGSTLLVPQFCQGLMGLTAMQTGIVMLPGSIATGVMMPVVGSIMRRKLMNPAVYAGMGLVLFYISVKMMANLTVAAGADGFLWPLIIRGAAMGLLFIPLTTISLATLSGTEIPQGTAVSNMIRQLGGSIGIAMITTFISISNAQHYMHLTEYVNNTNTAAVERVGMMRNLFLSKGYDMQSATQSAYAMLSRIITQQATLLTYRDVFTDIGFFFLAIIPLLLLFRNKKKEVHVEEEAIEWSME